MADRLEFKEKLSGILRLAEEKNCKISIGEVETYFGEDCLTDEQVGLVCDYLTSQKIKVSGYELKKGTIAEQRDETIELSREEQDYLKQYRQDLYNIRHSGDNKDRMAYYLPKVVDEALLLCNTETFLGDIIQEGNISLMLALNECGVNADDEPKIMEAVRLGMQGLIESQAESRQRDKNIVGQVAQLDEALKELKEELGREPDIGEISGRLCMTQEQIEDLLKLMGT